MSATIVAPATGPAPGGIAVLRLSGPCALKVGRRLAPGLPPSPEPRRMYLCAFGDGEGAVLDQGLAVYFQAPASYTGEDVVELHAHGSPRLMALLLQAALQTGEARLAEPGEFTRRAFLNGRLDLSRAEAVADLVAAGSEAAVRAAAAQLGGELSRKVAALRAPLLELKTDLEGVLNFPDEADDADLDLLQRLSPLGARARELLAEAGRGRLLRRGARVVLFGPVNAGKSTLFNRMLEEDRAIVDETPGTTRDLLEAEVEWEGLKVTLVDTAGLRDGPGRLEALGIARARRALAEADLAVLVLEPGATARDEETWRGEVRTAPVVVVRNKRDLHPSPSPDDALRVSGRTGEGVQALCAHLRGALWGGEAPTARAFVSERHADALRRASSCLDRALEAAEVSTLEVVSGEAGLALEALGEITGESAGDEVLDAIFRRFCIGK